jgi:hypothetical protein
MKIKTTVEFTRNDGENLTVNVELTDHDIMEAAIEKALVDHADVLEADPADDVDCTITGAF